MSRSLHELTTVCRRHRLRYPLRHLRQPGKGRLSAEVDGINQCLFHPDRMETEAIRRVKKMLRRDRNQIVDAAQTGPQVEIVIKEIVFEIGSVLETAHRLDLHDRPHQDAASATILLFDSVLDFPLTNIDSIRRR